MTIRCLEDHVNSLTTIKCVFLGENFYMGTLTHEKIFPIIRDCGSNLYVGMRVVEMF